MKPYILSVVAVLFCLSLNTGKAQILSAKTDYPVPAFSVSVNPLGFVQFGPIANAEFRLTDNMVLNTHVRFPTLGVVSYLVHGIDMEDDVMKGFAGGGGVIFFPGVNKSKPYVGILYEYERTNKTYDVGERWEKECLCNIGIFIFNGGYRFRFDNGFYMNTGAYLGAYRSNWSEEYTDTSYSTDTDAGIDVSPFGMLEVSLGLEF